MKTLPKVFLVVATIATFPMVVNADIAWTGAANDGGNVLTDGNWDGGTAPGSADTAVISDAPDAVLQSGAAEWKLLTIGSEADKTGTLKVTGGVLDVSSSSAVNTTAITIGNANGASGVLEIDGGTVNAYSLNTPNFAANATVNVKSGALKLTNWIDWGRNANGSQVFNHTGGDVTIGGNIYIGRENAGTGVWNMTGGNLFHTDDAFILGYGNNSAAKNTKGVFTQTGGNVFAAKGIYYGTARYGTGVYGSYTLGGGTLHTPFVTGRKADSTLVLDGGTIVASNVAANASFAISGIDHLTFGAGGGVLDTAGFAASISGCHVEAAHGGSAFVKKGAGTLTMDELPGVDSLVVSNGTLVVSSSYAPTAAQALAHRWSFTSDYKDSITGAAATTIGSAVALSDGKVSLTGNGNGKGSLNLGANLLDTTSATIEIWARHDAIKKWGRIFDYGSGEQNYFMMAWTYGTTANKNRVDSQTGGTQVHQTYDSAADAYALATNYYICATLQKNAEGKTVARWRRYNVDSRVLEQDGTLTMGGGIKDFANPVLYLGHSQFSADYDANATYDEVRVWNCILGDDAISESLALGPDATAAQLARLARPAAVEIAPGATLDLGGGSQKVSVLDVGGTLANGTLVVSKGLVVTPGQKMTVASGATLDLTGVTDVSITNPGDLPAGGWTFATSSSGGIPAAEPIRLSGDLAGYYLYLKGNKATIGKPGFMIIVR